jgi:glycosyltransferase involved in cell wall biosynthesis
VSGCRADTDDPLVSVMMPARNVAAVVTDTIRSIQAQTYRHWELVFVDDGSTDSTLAVVNRLARVDARIKVYGLPHGGRGRARNACLERSTGSLVAVCDADDISFPTRFEKQVRYLQQNPSVGAVASWWIPFSTAQPGIGGRVDRFPTDPSELQRCFRRGKMRFHNATAMIRMQLFQQFGGYHPEQKRAQDYEFFARVSRAGVRLAALPEPLLYYRQAADVPSLAYFHENGMYMAYADSLLAGKTHPFGVFRQSAAGWFWSVYYLIKYVYWATKLKARRLPGCG